MTLQEINHNIAANLARIYQEGGTNKAEFIKDLITHFSDSSNPSVSKETIYQMVNGGRKRSEDEDLSPVSFGIEKLHAVSEYLGVSIDGLISNDRPLTNDPEVPAICEYTGLNEKSILTLGSYGVDGLEYLPEIFNLLLEEVYNLYFDESKDFYSLPVIEAIAHYFEIGLKEIQDRDLFISLNGNLVPREEYDKKLYGDKKNHWMDICSIKGIKQSELVETALMEDVKKAMKNYLRRAKRKNQTETNDCDE